MYRRENNRTLTHLVLLRHEPRKTIHINGDDTGQGVENEENWPDAGWWVKWSVSSIEYASKDGLTVTQWVNLLMKTETELIKYEYPPQVSLFCIPSFVSNHAISHCVLTWH